MKVDGSLASVIQGVSQQPPETRLPGQCTLQENCTSNPVDGLQKRPPLDYDTTLFYTSSTPQFKRIAFGNDQEYLVAIYDNNLRVFTPSGVEKTVNIPGGEDYFPTSELITATLEYDTYILDRSVNVQMQSGTPSLVSHGAMVFLLGGNYGKRYEVTVTWTESGTEKSASAFYTTPDGSISSHVLNVASTYIAGQLEGNLNATTTNSFDVLFHVTRTDDVLHINWTDTNKTDSFKVTVSDDEGGTVLLVCNNDADSTSKLPRFAPQGYYVVIKGTGSTNADDYYLQFEIPPDSEGSEVSLGAGFGKPGIWRETSKADLDYQLDKTTMPHKLSYDPDTDEFSYAEVEWATRDAGDDDSNPLPGFVGNTINDMAFFQGRLTFLSNSSVDMSRTNKPENWFKNSGTQTVDSDPINMQSAADGVSKLERVTAHNRDLVVFAQNAQFIVFGRNFITPQNTSLVLTTTFEADVSVQPQPAGRNIFFPITYGDYIGIREFYTDATVDQNDSRPITEHVRKYIPGSPCCLSASSNFDMLLVSPLSSSSIFAYEYLWQDQKKVQASWSEWKFPFEVVYHWISGATIHCVLKRGTRYILGRINMDAQDDTDLDIQVKLDFKVEHENVNTTIQPVFEYDQEDYQFIQGPGCPSPGLPVLVDSYDDQAFIVTLKEDMGGGTVIAGLKYQSRYKPTMPVVKDEANNKITSGKLTIGKFIANIKDSGGFNVIKSSKYFSDILLNISGRIANDPDSVVGAPVEVSRVYTIPFRDSPEVAEIEFASEDYTPWTLLTLEWVGQYTKRGRRVTLG